MFFLMKGHLLALQANQLHFTKWKQKKIELLVSRPAVAERWRRWGLLFEFVGWETDTNDDCLGPCCSQPDRFDWDETGTEEK